jgi:predicted acyltransferase
VGLLVACGVACAGVGLAWDIVFPIGKKLWTSSFVMLTGGLGMIALAACLAVFDVAGWRKLARPFEIVGINAIFVYVGAGLVARVMEALRMKLTSGETTTLYDWVYVSWLRDPMLANVTSDERVPSLVFAIATVAFWWFVLWLMSRKGWSVRV